MTNYFCNYTCPITITITIIENNVMITANYNYKLPLPQHWLMLVIYVVNSDVDPVQMTKMSSMNRFHNIICCLPNSFSFSSNFPMNRFAYVGAILVPTAVPWICR